MPDFDERAKIRDSGERIRMARTIAGGHGRGGYIRQHNDSG